MTHTGFSTGPAPHEPAEERVFLHNVQWQTYERLLADLANQSSIRLSYNQGTLEIMTPLAEHEVVNRRLDLLIQILAAELLIEVGAFGSTTFRRAELERGFEPDSCFYVKNEQRVRGKRSIDLTVDPPPDLIVEIGITRNSMNKLPIYGLIGVSEVWRYDNSELKFYKLAEGTYTVSPNSVAFPILTSEEAFDLISSTMAVSSTQFLRTLQQWARNLCTS